MLGRKTTQHSNTAESICQVFQYNYPLMDFLTGRSTEFFQSGLCFRSNALSSFFVISGVRATTTFINEFGFRQLRPSGFLYTSVPRRVNVTPERANDRPYNAEPMETLHFSLILKIL
jgi:hypothetical protein